MAAATGAQALGYVHELTGTASVRRGAAAAQPLRIGDLVDQGQTVTTGLNSTAVIKFEDGQVMALHERSSFAVREYQYNNREISASRAAFEMLRGGLRFITGVIGSTNRNAVRITAGTATIGIRGTDGTIVYDPATRAVSTAVHAGAIAMTTPLGTQTIGVGAFSTATPSAPPAPPRPVAQAAPAIQQAVVALVQQPVPVNTPVVVQVSARAVVAQAQALRLQQQAAQQPTNTALQQAAQQAQQQAQQAVAQAASAAQTAYQTAIQAGAVPPAPPAPPPAPKPPAAAPKPAATAPKPPAETATKPAATETAPATATESTSTTTTTTTTETAPATTSTTTETTPAPATQPSPPIVTPPLVPPPTPPPSGPTSPASPN